MERGRCFTQCAPKNKYYSVPVREAVENNQVVKYSTFCFLHRGEWSTTYFFLKAAFKQAVTTALLSLSQWPNLQWPQITLSTSTRSSCSSATAATESKAGKTQVSDQEKCIEMRHTNRKQASTGSRKSGKETKPHSFCRSIFLRALEATKSSYSFARKVISLLCPCKHELHESGQHNI